VRVLLATNHLSRVGGSERHAETLYRTLTAAGHRVDVYVHTQKNYLIPEAAGLKAGASYDLALVSHTTCLQALRGMAARTVFTSHGVLPALERAEPGADVYVGVSEEVCAAIPFPSVLIRNPIDTERFRPVRPVNDQLRRILFLSTHQGEALPVVQAAARGYELEVLGRGAVTGDVPAAINRADLVVGLGRSAVEAMACGRNVVVFDYRGGDGMVTADNVDLLKRRNFSGRTHQRWFTADELRAEFERYDPAVNLRPYVLAEHEVSAVARAYLSL
jgi:hypothetical protein